MNQQFHFSELTHRIIYYNHYNAIGQFAGIVIIIGLILFIISLYLLLKSI
jgi:hypothetical protein